MIKGVLFDKDGTLLEFHSTMHYIYGRVFACLKSEYRVPELLLQQMKEALGYLPDRLKPGSLLQFSTNPQIVAALLEPVKKYTVAHPWQQPFDKTDILALIERLSLSEDVPYTVLPGVPETLGYLKRNAYKLGIATADTLAATVAGLKRTGLFDYFDYLGTDDDSKPKPETFLAEMFCRRCRIAPDEVLIVGDSQNDMLFAENAGASFIGIEPAGNTAPVFQNTGHRSVSNIHDMIALLDL